jgi:hypothetical protein
MPDPLPYPGMPRWVKVAGIIAALLILLVLVIILSAVGGSHGPGRHMSGSDGGSAARHFAGQPIRSNGVRGQRQSERG